MGEPAHAAADIVDRIEDRARPERRVTFGEVFEALGARGYGPFLFAPALVELSPLGAIPGVPTLLAAIIILFATQIAAGRRHLWLPERLKRRSIPAASLGKAVGWMRPVARWLDRWFRPRLTVLTSPPVIRGVAVVTVLLCLTVPPLELIPWASSAPMAAIALFGLALLARDGLVMAAAIALLAIGAGVTADLLIGSGAETPQAA
jgi:hypothetical protein